jgi:hypothetical protein
MGYDGVSARCGSIQKKKKKCENLILNYLTVIIMDLFDALYVESPANLIFAVYVLPLTVS